MLKAACALALVISSCTSAPGGVQMSEEEIQKIGLQNRINSASLVSTGNAWRVQQVIDRARKGEEIVIAVIGGSITEGASAATYEQSWGPLFTEGFRKRFAPGNGSSVKLVNAGMSGTPSTLGMIRYQRDVVGIAGRSPDLVVVEFAVNDNDDPSKGAAYESLVRGILQAENNPAVILLFSVFANQWNLQNRLEPVGRRYDLPMVSMKNSLGPEISEGAITNAQYFADQWHPTTWGHELVAGALLFCVDQLASQSPAPADTPLPDTAAIGFQFTGVRMIDAATTPSGATVKPGSFSLRDPALGTLRYDSARKTFADNWHHPATAGTESAATSPFELAVKAKNLLLVYKISSDPTFGRAEVLIDGKSVATLDGYSQTGWNQAWTVLLLDEPSSAVRNLAVRMVDGDEHKSFSILAIGYTE